MSEKGLQPEMAREARRLDYVAAASRVDRIESGRVGSGAIALAGVMVLAVTILFGTIVPAKSQVETIPSPPAQYSWENILRAEGHLALRYSPAGAFSPDSSVLAVVNRDKIALTNLRTRDISKTLRIRLQNISDIDIQSANSLANGNLFILANGLVAAKGKSVVLRSPELAFQWDPAKDELSGKIDAVGKGGGFLPARYFPCIHYLC
ncbi:MAG: hypothetical protein ACRD2O_17965, partial [Terriglobia bacterium]